MFHERFRPPPVALKALVPVIGPRAVAEALSRESEFKRRFLRPCARPIDPTTLDELYAPYRQPDACRAAALTWSAYKRGLGDFVRARRTLPRITAPTTVLFGARDPYCTPASARAFASRIPHARLRLLDDVGHFTPTEAPTEVADELNSLLQRAN
jgi:pimeloyl-ACP methyl ester carboxylesterase